MNDLLSELDSIDGDTGSSGGKQYLQNHDVVMVQDGSSSPLRPNPKYCSMAQPTPRRPAARNSPRPKLSASNAVPTEAVNELPLENIRDRVASSDIPETVKKIMVSTMSGGMEIDEDTQQSNKSSSPLKPNEKYCSIATPSRQRIARVAPQPAPSRYTQASRNQASPSYSAHCPNAYVPGRTSAVPAHSFSNSSHYVSMDRLPSPDYYARSNVYALPYHSVARSSGYPSYHDEILHGGYDAQRHNGLSDNVRGERRGSLDSHDLYSTPESSNAKEKTLAEWSRQREMGEKKRVLAEQERKKDMQRRMREQAENAERQRESVLRDQEQKRERDRRMREEAEEVEKQMEMDERNQANRRARAQLNSYVDVKPKREASTVSLTREELEELKARYKAEGEREALAEARRAEAFARLNQCLHKIEARKEEEPEPMDVEESDVVESSVPSSSSGTRIAPMLIIVKAEPREKKEMRPIMSKKEVPMPLKARDIENVEEEKGTEDVVQKDGEDEIQIIEKPPAEVITLSCDEDTVAETMTYPLKTIKQEHPTTSMEEDFWIIGTQRGKKKKHVFDPSKVKQEKEDEREPKVSETSALKLNIPFNAVKVKTELVEKGKTSRRAKMAMETVPLPSKVKCEPDESSMSEDRITKSPTRVPYGPALPPKQPGVPQPVNDELAAKKPQDEDVAAALVAARKLLREIGKPVQPALKLQLSLSARKPREVHQPSPGSFMHSLRMSSRKRSQWCDVDEDEEEWLRSEESSERHDWGAKRGRIEEDEEALQ